MKGFLLICGLLASCVSGHMQMSKPLPIRSPLNDNAKGPKDWSYTNPLDTSGSDYPCKGYVDDPWHPVAEYSPGEEYEMELEGSATHGGGSCQLSLSYDNGKTFRVIHSMLGGCPIPKKYNFMIPKDAPSGKALFTWTWFNKIGNREMYMNCAQVTIKGGSSKREHRDVSLVPRASLSDLPPIFIANVDGPGQCTTIGGEEVDFPLPGPSVEGSVSGKGYKCESHAPFLGDGSSGSSSSSSSAEAPASTSSSSSEASHATLSSSASVIPSSSSSAMPSSSASVTPSSSASASASSSSKVPSSFGTSSAAHVPATPAPGSCTSGELICAEDGKSFSMCAHGVPVFMGPVAAGTLCRNGGIGHA